MKSKKLLGYLFAGVVIIFLCLSVFSYVSKKTMSFIEQSSNEEEADWVEIDWEELYPFSGTKPDVKKEIGAVEKVYNYIKDHCTFYTSSRLVGYYSMIETAKFCEDLIHWNIAAVDSYNPVVKLQDGYLTSFTGERDVQKTALNVIEFAEYCREKNIDFCYINFPHKICSSDDKNISGVFDWTNKNADEFLNIIARAGIKNYDVRKFLHDDGMKHHEAFFRTDHHWKPETGLWAAKHIAEILRDDFGYNVNPKILSPENFDKVIYRDWFLGSQGKKFTLVRCEPEDISLIYPKYETHLTFEVLSRKVNTSGDFSIMYDMWPIETKDYYKKNPYGAYNYADIPFGKIHNSDASCKKKILIIHESMSNCVVPFLALTVSDMIETDLRNFTGSLKSLIISERPDTIIIQYTSDVPGRDEKEKSVSKKFYDFR